MSSIGSSPAGRTTPPAATSLILDALLAEPTPDPVEVVTALLVGRVPDIPGARSASITQHSSARGFVTVAASDDIARRVDAAQYRLGDGPCLRAVTGTLVAPDSAALRRLWPELTDRIEAETPVRAVASVPMGPGAALGSLNVYSDEPEGFAPPALTAAIDLAAACALGLAALRQRERADNLLLALENSRRIGAAIGIVMATKRCTSEQAFDLMRRASQRTHQKLRDIAEDILLTGTVPEQ